MIALCLSLGSTTEMPTTVIEIQINMEQPTKYGS